MAPQHGQLRKIQPGGLLQMRTGLSEPVLILPQELPSTQVTASFTYPTVQHREEREVQ